MNLLLIGYRGTGKSTVGRLCAESLGYAFVDADDVVEATSGCSIREIFAAGGEEAFRDLESQVIADLVGGNRQVVALGGGAVLREANRHVIGGENQRVAWLHADAETLYNRINSDPLTSQRRPNLTVGGGLAEVERMLEIRDVYYRACAQRTFDTQLKSPHQIAAEIVSWLA